ncbi:MAG: hypothetical protein ACRDY7_06105 [Acidimicrobiia bacterium]
MEPNGGTAGPSTMTEIIDGLERKGYKGQFGARPGAAIRCFTCRREFPATDAGLVELHRTEGASDPAEMSVIGALVCPHCGARGTLVLMYGPEGASEDAEALLALEDLR